MIRTPAFLRLQHALGLWALAALAKVAIGKINILHGLAALSGDVVVYDQCLREECLCES